jgi:CheY-like chemotaxis protein
MNGILGMSEILASTRMTKAQQECHSTISICATTLLNLLNDILDLSKIEHGRLELEWIPVDLKRLLKEVVDINTYVAREKGIKLGFEMAEDVPRRVMCDSLRLRQILINLCGNALKFTDKGQVHIRVTLEREEGDTSWVRFMVKDTGIGIPPDKKHSIFEVFSQADGSHTRRYGGTGLGLAISKQLVDLFKGRIWLESMEGEGTRFFFSLPLVRLQEETAPPCKKKKAAKKASKKKASKAASPGRKKKAKKKAAGDVYRILLAEDNPVNQKVASKLLQKAGFEVEAVENGKEALEAVEKGRFDLVLMDVQMPVMDGLTASLEIRKKYEHLPIIAVTAHALEEDRQRCFDAKMNDYITKPVRSETLIPKIKSWLPGGENRASLGGPAKAKSG